MSGKQITIDEAVEVFVRGFSFTRSFTHPYVPEEIEKGVWVTRDAPRRSGNYRKQEYIAHGFTPAKLHTIARKHAAGHHYHICPLLNEGEDDESLRDGFRNLGYRLMATEPFMVNDLRKLSEVAGPVPIKAVETGEEATRLAKTAGKKQILPQHLSATPQPMREYMAVDDERIVGWVGSIAVGSYRWCANMYVAPSHRRRGIARALMTRMLFDDREGGAKANVLASSHTGSKLYPLVGYRQIGTLYLYVPPRG